MNKPEHRLERSRWHRLALHLQARARTGDVAIPFQQVLGFIEPDIQRSRSVSEVKTSLALEFSSRFVIREMTREK